MQLVSQGLFAFTFHWLPNLLHLVISQETKMFLYHQVLQQLEAKKMLHNHMQALIGKVLVNLNVSTTKVIMNIWSYLLMWSKYKRI